MKTEWSSQWSSSVQPRKQRKFRANAPLHTRKKLVSANVDKKLRAKLKSRSMPLCKGDEVKVVRGGKKGMKGKVSKVDIKRLKVYIEGQIRETLSGNKVPVPFEPSNLIITDLNMDDKFRQKKLERKGVSKKDIIVKKEEKEEKKPEKKTEAPEEKK
jgi:large subunit ribosomal protein L24